MSNPANWYPQFNTYLQNVGGPAGEIADVGGGANSGPTPPAPPTNVRVTTLGDTRVTTAGDTRILQP